MLEMSSDRRLGTVSWLSKDKSGRWWRAHAQAAVPKWPEQQRRNALGDGHVETSDYASSYVTRRATKLDPKRDPRTRFGPERPFRLASQCWEKSGMKEPSGWECPAELRPFFPRPFPFFCRADTRPAGGDVELTTDHTAR